MHNYNFENNYLTVETWGIVTEDMESKDGLFNRKQISGCSA